MSSTLNKTNAYHMFHAENNSIAKSKRPKSAQNRTIRGPWQRSADALNAAVSRMAYLDNVNKENIGGFDQDDGPKRCIPKANNHVRNLAKPRAKRLKYEDEKKRQQWEKLGFKSVQGALKQTQKRPKSAVQLKKEKIRMARLSAMSKPRRRREKYIAGRMSEDTIKPQTRALREAEELMHRLSPMQHHQQRARGRVYVSPKARKRPTSAPPSSERRRKPSQRRSGRNSSLDLADKHIKKCIKRREKKVRNFRSFLNALSDARRGRDVKMPDPMVTMDTFENFVGDVRIATLEAIAAIESWRKQLLEGQKSGKNLNHHISLVGGADDLKKGKPVSYFWQEENYLTRIPESLDFMGTMKLSAVVKGIAPKMGLSRNPFLLCIDSVWGDRAPFFTAERVILEEEKKCFDGFHRGHFVSFVSDKTPHHHTNEGDDAQNKSNFHPDDHRNEDTEGEEDDTHTELMMGDQSDIDEDQGNSTHEISLTSSRSVLSAPTDAITLLDHTPQSKRHPVTTTTTPANVKIQRLSATVEELKGRLEEVQRDRWAFNAAVGEKLPQGPQGGHRHSERWTILSNGANTSIHVAKRSAHARRREAWGRFCTSLGASAAAQENMRRHMFLCAAREDELELAAKMAKAVSPENLYRPSIAQRISIGKSFVAACRDGNEVLVRESLAEGADPGQSNERGETPLHFSCENGHTAITSMLLEMNAGVHAADTIGRMPLHVAAENGRQSCMKLLLEHGAKVNSRAHGETTSLHICASLDHDECASTLVLFDADLQAKDASGLGPIHYAAQNNATSVLRLLADHDVDVDSVDAQQNTALHLAVGNGHVDLVKMLLGYAAQTSLKNASGDTPAAIAVRNQCNEISTLLTEYGATPRIPEPVEDWAIYTDEETGAQYWYSHSRQESTWVVPDDEEEAKESDSESGKTLSPPPQEASAATTLYTPGPELSFKKRLAKWVGHEMHAFEGWSKF
eukprot:g768.t1